MKVIELDSESINSLGYGNDDGSDSAGGNSKGSYSTSGDRDTSNSSSSNTGGGGLGSKRSTQDLASQETRAVTWSKVLMILVLLSVAAVAAVTVFKYTTQQEYDDFEVRFTDFAYQIIGVYEVNADTIVDTYENFAIEISSVAKHSNETWPYVTIPAFEAQATRVMEQTGSRTMGVAHYVMPEQVDAWIGYSMQNIWWKQEGYDYQGMNQTAGPLPPFIWGDFRNFGPLDGPLEEYGFYAVMWQGAPIIESERISNFDAFRLNTFPPAYERMMESNAPLLSGVRNLNEEDAGGFGTSPESVIFFPIYKEVKKNQTSSDDIVATISSIIPWDNYFLDLLPGGIDGIILVVSNTCNQTFSYEINGPTVQYLGVGDFHNEVYDDLVVETTFSPFDTEMECLHTISLYPSETFESTYETDKPKVYTIAVLCLFLLTVLVFFLYDCLVERRQSKVLSTAERSTAIVSSLFPQRVADKLMKQEEEKKRLAKEKARRSKSKPVMLGQSNMANKLSLTLGAATSQTDSEYGGSGEFEIGLNDIEESTSKPMAELFPSATVFFADLVGFTAWSSSREPHQVFELLEEIYSSFDAIARRKKVFKVETIGDCYMAATGLPEKRDDHAILMARFARDSLRKMLRVVQKLEVRLGPGTADLGLRIGIHSGPVTAGVLRGEKARFQLFGDTVNTAARMESTGAKNKIHLSAETAELIRSAEYKDIWTSPRKEQIEAKGKGKLQTHWLAYTDQGGRSVSSSGTSVNTADISSGDSAGRGIEPSMRSSLSNPEVEETLCIEMLEDSEQKKLDRSIDWGVDILQRLLKRVVAMRGGMDKSLRMRKKPMPSHGDGTQPLEEVKDIIELPSQERAYAVSPSEIELPPQVIFQLRDFVRAIASLYHNNPFHSFDHATHVTQSVTKLLTRVVTPNTGDSERNHKMHQYTYGLTSDPLAQFSVAFSALIHDVDHPGVPNATLVKEESPDAVTYQNKSVAEQNSVDVAWKLLSAPCYAELRACIFTNKSEYQRFRQLVVNTVLATDIVDKELGAARKKRWADAFASSDNAVSTTDDSESEAMLDANRKATIVIEHLIQASDVAHTMQHWHVYLKWNEKFFNECYKAYLEGRAEKDPSEGWYQGELGFFDFYVIPLAKKLKECQVFGVASDEYLQYAEANRREWEVKGDDLVQSYLQKYHKIASQRKANARRLSSRRPQSPSASSERRTSSSSVSSVDLWADQVDC